MKNNQPEFYFATAEEAESAFYSAFEMGDAQLMDAVLADQSVSCIHPNSLPIVGREAVLDSWVQILSHINEPAVYPEVLNRSVIDDVAVHLVAERIAADHQIGSETSLVLATNVYIRQKNGWRMMMHHASVSSHAEETEEQEAVITHEAPQTLQ